jgi:hypothetical protein
MSEMTNLAHSLALTAAAALLDCETLSVELGGQRWMDVDTDVDGVPLGIALKNEIRYLTLRGALLWHPDKPNLVRIVETQR